MFLFDHINFYKAKLPFSDSSRFWGSRRNWGHSEGEEAPSLLVVYKQRLAFAWIIVCSCGGGWFLFYILLDCIHICVLKMKMHVDNHKRCGAVGKSEGDFFFCKRFFGSQYLDAWDISSAPNKGTWPKGWVGTKVQPTLCSLSQVLWCRLNLLGERGAFF